MYFKSGEGLDFDDVKLIANHTDVSSRADVNLIRTIKTKHSKQELSGCPIIVANMAAVGTIPMAKYLFDHKIFVCLHKFYETKELVEFFNQPHSIFTFYTTGISEKDIEKLINVSKETKLTKLCVDVANGHMSDFGRTLSWIRSKYPDVILMAGNIVTGELVQQLVINHGVDICKVGNSNGGHCTTYDTTHFGCSQLTTIIETANVAHGLNAHIVGDGGVKRPGHFVCGLAGGADFMMAGTIFSGYEQNECEWNLEEEKLAGKDGVPTYTGRKLKKSMRFFGSSSKEAMEEFGLEMGSYRAAEGRCSEIPYKGDIGPLIQQIKGGLSSACSYSGTNDIKHLHKCAVFEILKHRSR